MSRFLKKRFEKLNTYTPGEQPRDMEYIKLNTNESPFPPDEYVYNKAALAAEKFNIYSDPECIALREKAAKLYGVDKDNILCANGSDEILYLVFTAFINKVAFPDITYGFYKVFAEITEAEQKIISLDTDFKLNYKDYINLDSSIIIANPNAQTGRYVPVCEIEEIIKSNRHNLVIVDEAYIDFGGQSCISLINKYDNLLVTQTFSKSRSMAGARLGFAIASKELIKDINTIKYCINPYNVNTVTQAAGIAAIERNDIYMAKCRKIMHNRSFASEQLKKLGFTVVPSQANFILARSNRITGEMLYRELKKRGILVRHFNETGIADYVRITIGTEQQMKQCINAVERILNAKSENSQKDIGNRSND